MYTNMVNGQMQLKKNGNVKCRNWSNLGTGFLTDVFKYLTMYY